MARSEETTFSTLRTAYDLREHVLPMLASASDLFSFALSCPELLLFAAARALRCIYQNRVFARLALPPALPAPPVLQQCRIAADDADLSDLPLAPLSLDSVRKPLYLRMDDNGLPLGADADEVADLAAPLRVARDDPAAGLRAALLAARSVLATTPLDAVLARAFDDAEAALGPTKALSLAEGLALSCALGAEELVRAFGEALGGEAAHKEARARLLVCVASASGDGGAVLRVLALPPFSLGHGDAHAGRLRCDHWLFDPHRSLAEPWALGRTPPQENYRVVQPHYALCAAAATGDVAAIRALVGEPYAIASEPPLGFADTSLGCVSHAVEVACACGRAESLAALQELPLSPGRCGLLLSSWNLGMAFASGSVATVDALARPPWGLGHIDAKCQLRILLGRWGPGSAAVLRRLKQPPYSVRWPDVAPSYFPNGRVVVEALAVLTQEPHAVTREQAARHRHSLGELFRFVDSDDDAAQLLSLLSGAPFFLTPLEARGMRLLARAAHNGLCGMLAALARPPYGLGRIEAVAAKCLRKACKHGMARVLDVLAAPPFSLGHSDVEILDVAAIVVRSVYLTRSAAVLKRLVRHPYDMEAEAVRRAVRETLEKGSLGELNSMMCINESDLRAVRTAYDLREWVLPSLASTTGMLSVANSCPSSADFPAWLADALAEPPFSMGHSDIAVLDVAAIVVARPECCAGSS
eukprot:m51a1_g14772 hypothetical protein (700) ;mRNA; f:413010-415743